MALFKRSSSALMKVGAFDGVDCRSSVKNTISSAEYMRNFRITPQGKLKKRCGYRPLIEMQGIKSVYVYGDVLFYQIDDFVYAYSESDGVIREYDMSHTGEFSYFSFGDRVYVISSESIVYYEDGWFFEGEPYVPTVAVGASNTGGGMVHESLNLLTDKAKMTFSPDGKYDYFVLPSSAIGVWRVTENGETIPDDRYTFDVGTKHLTLDHVPPSGVPESVCVWFTVDMGVQDAPLLYGKDFCVYGERTDSRVFVYGDGNVIYYSDITPKGADPLYIPAENYITVGDAGQVTSLVRHYSSLAVFTDRDAWYISPSSLDYDGYEKPTFPIFPLNGKVGCVRGGGVLAENCPVTVNANGVYRWTSSSVRDERNATRISEKISPQLSQDFLKNARACDLEYRKEVWIYSAGLVLVYNYECDAWYFFDGIPAVSVFEYKNEALFLSEDGIFVFDEEVYTDNGAMYRAIWQSGFADFGLLGKKRLYRAYVSMIPETNSHVTLTLVPNEGERVTLGANGEFSNAVLDFSCVDFRRFTFECEGRPKPVRCRVRLRRFSSIRLVIESYAENSRATVESVVLQ